MFARLASSCRVSRLCTPVYRLLIAKNVSSIAPETRIVPKMMTFYSANPLHEAHVDNLEALIRKYTKRISDRVRVSQSVEDGRKWLSFEEYGLIGGGTRLKPAQYRQLISLLNRLQSIDPQLMSNEILSTISQYYRKTRLQMRTTVVRTLDEEGRASAVGRRKASVAKVWVARGNGDILVNGRQLNNYFVKMKDRDTIMYPLSVIDSVGKYNIFATTNGGGTTGQAGAISHALAQALVIFNPLLKTRLHKSGVLTRDYRHVERKKPGKKKARKMPAWVKR